ncbi:TPA: hypothetical protein ACH3X3_005024 [Trebouxia sp. C0006]
MREKLGVPKDEVTSLCLSAYTNFGTTMAGLVATGYQIDVDDWHAHIHHTLPYEKYLKKDDALRNLLQRIKLPLYVFTNGDRKHAEICLRLMGITDCFKGVVCYESIMDAAEDKGYVDHGVPVVCKPSVTAIELALEQANNASAETTIFLDDSTRNIVAGHQKGLTTVLVGRTGMDTGADAEILNLLDLPTVAPHIWKMLTTSNSIDSERNNVSHTTLENRPGDTIAADARVPVLSG